VTTPAFVRIENTAPTFPPASRSPTGFPRFPRHGSNRRNVLIIGYKSGEKLAAYLRQHPTAGCAISGFLDDSEAVGGDVLGRVADLATIARAKFVDEVILTAPYQHDLASAVIQEARRQHLSLKVMPDFFGIEPRSLAMEKVGDVPVLTLRQESASSFQRFLKRAADIVFSAAILLAISPLLAVIACAILLDSRGPVLYRAQRVGKKGRAFSCHKFRTMILGADQFKDSLRGRNEREGPTFKLAADPRITRVGRFLRRHSLDELPQLWNVFRGEMSLVGPRPHPLDDCERYALDHLRRLDVTPGLTGLWQVTARNDPSFHRSLELDLEYIEHWSFWLDLRILWKTVPAVLEGSGS
jgi:exopolysaccharide biosynthesis polyprenyl glycosylphosphotransferase